MNSLSIQKEKIENLASFNSQFFAISENYKNGNYLKAEELALISNNNFPNNEFILRILSDIYEKQNKKPEAINTYLQLIKVAPDDLASYTNLGILYLQTDKLKKAEKIFRKALEKRCFFGDFK